MGLFPGLGLIESWKNLGVRVNTLSGCDNMLNWQEWQNIRNDKWSGSQSERDVEVDKLSERWD